MTVHTHSGMGKGLKVVTQGQTIQDEYITRQPGVHNVSEQQCNPLAKAGSEREDQNPLHPNNRKKARRYSSRSDDKLKQALAEDLATRGIQSNITKTTETNDNN